MGRIMADEERHQDDGARSTLVEIDDGRKDAVQALVDKWFPRAIQLLGRPQSEGNRLAARYGLKHADSLVEMRDYIAQIMPIVTAGGLTLPTPADLRGRGIDIAELTW